MQKVEIICDVCGGQIGNGYRATITQYNDVCERCARVLAATIENKVNSIKGQKSRNREKMIANAFITNRDCKHPKENLLLLSGDYYIYCNLCNKRWAVVGGQPEYGEDKDGNPIGANSLLANLNLK